MSINIKCINALILILSTIFFTQGCRTVGAPKSPYQQWGAPKWEKTTKAEDKVWASIREKTVDSSKPLVLTELIEIAVYNNPTTRQAWQQARASEAELKQAQSEYYPQITVNADGTRERADANQDTANLDELRYGPASKASFLLLDFGGRSASVEEAFQLILSANFQFNQSLQDLLFNTEKAYYDYYSSQSFVESAIDDLADAQEAYIIAQHKFEVGLASKLDELQSKSSYDQALYSLEDAKGNFEIAKAELAQVLGFPADYNLQIAMPVGDVPMGISEDDVTQLIEEALSNRPDISGLRAQLRAKEAAIKTANSDLWPRLNIGGSTQNDWYKFYDVRRQHDKSSDYMGYLSVEWDIFDGFYNLNKKRQSEAEALSQREALISAELKAASDVWSKYYNFKTSVAKFKYSESFLENAKASYDLAFSGYKTGLKSILDLLNAQSSLSDARSKLVESRKDTLISLADLAHATGSLKIASES